MKTYWDRLEKWLKENAAHLLEELEPGATEEDITSLEALIGRKLPADFVEFYRIHDGQREGREGLIHAEELLPMKWIINQWTCWNELLLEGTFTYNGKLNGDSEPDPGVKDDHWNPYWVPFTYDGSGNHICIDLDPAPGGTFGQVIRMWHDSGYRDRYAASFEAYIADYVSKLETGDYVYARDWGLVRKDSPFNQ